MSNESLVGKAVWIEMDRDRSAVLFSPRKAIIIHRFMEPIEKEAWVIALDPPPVVLLPIPRRLRHLVLQYYNADEHSMSMTFQSGVSYAEVLRMKRKKTQMSETLRRPDVSRIGSALVYPWPKPQGREMRIVHEKVASK